MEYFNQEMYEELELYRRIVESSAETIIIHCDEKIVYINQAGVQLLGAFSKEEVIGKPMFDIVAEEFEQRARERFRYILKENNPVGLIDGKVIRFDGTLVDVEVSSTPVFYNGKPAVQVVCRDITMRKTMEQKLKESEQRYQSLYNAITGGIIVRDSKGLILHVNEGACDILGVKREELEPPHLEQCAWEFIERDGTVIPDEQIPFHVALRTGKPIRSFVTGVRGLDQSSHRWILANYEPFFSTPNGPPTGVVSTFLDMHELKQTQEKLEESEERYRLLIANLPDKVAISTDGVFTFINKAGASMLGADEPKELIGKRTSLFIEKNDRDNLRMFEEKAQREKQVSGLFEYKALTLDNKIMDMETIFIPITYKGKPSALGVSRNITERKKMEEVFRKADTLSIAGNLAAGVAHEVRNPLTVIRGFMQLFNEQVDDRNKEFIKLILEEVERIELIINEFLMLHKPQTNTFKKNNIETIMQNTVALFDTQAIMKNIEIKIDYDSDLPLINCEENQLKQVFINLLKNAMEAMFEGGVINVQIKQDKEGILIRVTDQGCGIPPEKIKKLGEPFYTTKEKGTGLGLMVSYNIIKNHNGKINVTSTPEQGTSFEIFLPK